MKSSEILGALRDLVDKIAQDDETPAVNVYPAEKRFVAVDVSKTPDDLANKEHDKELPLDTMVPPLQQKMELLKRAVDIDNVFDGTSVDKTTNGQEDYKSEIATIQKNAGVPTAAIMALTDEEPLDD
jgi:hypothetical protein